jgi:hypothetical protein
VLSRTTATFWVCGRLQKKRLRLKPEAVGRNVAAMNKSALLIVLSLAAGAVQAQTAGVVTLRANATSATGSMAPVLTWSTNPVATSCAASGGWSGTKAAAGTQTLATIRASTNYTLTCTWGTGSATVNWTAPTTNTDGSALTNLASFRIYYGTSASSLSQKSDVTDNTRRSATISPLTPGTWYFAVRAVNTSGTESDSSNVTSKAVAGATAAKSVAITITPATQTRVTIATSVYDIVRISAGNWVLGRVVGTAPVGTPCRSAYHLTGDYYGINTGYVKLTRTPRGDTLVAHCAYK